MNYWCYLDAWERPSFIRSFAFHLDNVSLCNLLRFVVVDSRVWQSSLKLAIRRMAQEKLTNTVCQPLNARNELVSIERKKNIRPRLLIMQSHRSIWVHLDHFTSPSFDCSNKEKLCERVWICLVAQHALGFSIHLCVCACVFWAMIVYHLKLNHVYIIWLITYFN